jgi:hypothetical protein
MEQTMKQDIGALAEQKTPKCLLISLRLFQRLSDDFEVGDD